MGIEGGTEFWVEDEDEGGQGVVEDVVNDMGEEI